MELPGGVVNGDKMRLDPSVTAFVKRSRTTGSRSRPSATPGPMIEADAVRGPNASLVASLKTDLKGTRGAKWVDEEVVVDKELRDQRKPDDIPAYNEKGHPSCSPNDARPSAAGPRPSSGVERAAPCIMRVVWPHLERLIDLAVQRRIATLAVTFALDLIGFIRRKLKIEASRTSPTSRYGHHPLPGTGRRGSRKADHDSGERALFGVPKSSCSGRSRRSGVSKVVVNSDGVDIYFARQRWREDPNEKVPEG